MSVLEGSSLKTVLAVYSVSKNVSRKGEGSGEWAQATAAMPLACCGTASCSMMYDRSLQGTKQSFYSLITAASNIHCFPVRLQEKVYLRHSL